MHRHDGLLAMNESLDLETQCRTDSRDVLSVELLQNCCLPSVIKATSIVWRFMAIVEI